MFFELAMRKLFKIRNCENIHPFCKLALLKLKVNKTKKTCQCIDKSLCIIYD